MTAVVADTHAVLWYLLADPRLSRPAREAMETATAYGEKIYVPTICIVEATYLSEKNRIKTDSLAQLGRAIAVSDSSFEAIPLTLKIAILLSEISRISVPDMPDRIIAATALALKLPLITRDGKIRASGIKTVW